MVCNIGPLFFFVRTYVCLAEAVLTEANVEPYLPEAWTEQETGVLEHLVGIYGPTHWSTIAAGVATKSETQVQCEISRHHLSHGAKNHHGIVYAIWPSQSVRSTQRMLHKSKLDHFQRHVVMIFWFLPSLIYGWDTYLKVTDHYYVWRAIEICWMSRAEKSQGGDDRLWWWWCRRRGNLRFHTVIRMFFSILKKS